MFSDPSPRIPVNPWKNFHFRFLNAAKTFFYCTLSSPLPLAVIRSNYSIHDSSFYSECFEVHNFSYPLILYLKIVSIFLQTTAILKSQFKLITKEYLQA